MIFSGAFLAKLTSIAVDRLLALLLGITYGQVVIVNRTRTVVLFIWMKRNCGRPTLPLEHDIIPPFKSSIDNIRADYFNVFLLRNISHHSTSTNTTAGWIRREKSRNLAKHDAIKEDGHQCVVGSPYISSLLSFFFWCDSCSPYSRGKLVSFSGRSTCRMCSLPKLVDKSSSLLLENQGNSKSSEGIHNRIFSLVSRLNMYSYLCNESKKFR